MLFNQLDQKIIKENEGKSEDDNKNPILSKMYHPGDVTEIVNTIFINVAKSSELLECDTSPSRFEIQDFVGIQKCVTKKIFKELLSYPMTRENIFLLHPEFRQ